MLCFPQGNGVLDCRLIGLDFPHRHRASRRLGRTPAARRREPSICSAPHIHDTQSHHTVTYRRRSACTGARRAVHTHKYRCGRVGTLRVWRARAHVQRRIERAGYCRQRVSVPAIHMRDVTRCALRAPMVCSSPLSLSLCFQTASNLTCGESHHCPLSCSASPKGMVYWIVD